MYGQFGGCDFKTVLQRLKPCELYWADVVAKATTYKDYRAAAVHSLRQPVAADGLY
jgi:hypothetical protein